MESTKQARKQAVLVLSLVCFGVIYKEGFANSITNLTQSLLAMIAIFVAVLIYLLPSTIAFARSHHNAVPILLTNLFLGWTFIGWVAALIWSTTATAQLPVTNQNGVTK
jgi:hypothetical protein